MNPLKALKNWVIGDALVAADDIFEKGKIELLYNFSCLFLLLSIGYLVSALNAPIYQLILAIFGVILLLIVLIAIKTSENVLWASYLYILSHTVQNFSYMIISNGVVSPVAIPFLILYVSFGFLLLGRGWGIGLTLLTVILFSIGVYNESTHFSLFFIQGAGIKNPPELMMLFPLVLNAYLVSEFFKVRQKAEKQIHEQKAELEKNHAELADKNKDTVASINYASRIQQAMLPTAESILRSIPLSFLLYKPRDIVCGDFYWFQQLTNDSYIIVCADCTGHGVPGALMTMIGNSALNRAVVGRKITEPYKILQEIDIHISETLKQQKQHLDIVQDSMDLALLKVDTKNKEFIFCGAKRPAIYIHNGELTEFKGSKYTLGGLKEEKKFEEIKQSYAEDDAIYLFTDGYTDQFGGGENKKFMIKQFRDLLLKVSPYPMQEQKNKLEAALEEWKKNDSQTDDILVVGIKF